MTTWRAQAANGWYPKINPTGTHVLFGFWQTFVANLLTGVETEITAPTGARLCPLGWLDANTFLAASEGGPAAVYRMTLDDLRPVDLGVDPALVPFNWGNAHAGHYALSGRDVCTKDGREFRPPSYTGRQYGVWIGGDHLVTSNHETELLHFLGNDLVRRLPMDNAWTVNEFGDITSGYFGELRCYPWGQGYVDATVTPWRRESVACTTRVNGDLWLWSASEDGGHGMVLLGRRLGEKNPIILRDFPAATGLKGGISAVWTGREWVVGGSDDKGRLQVRRVSMDAERVDFSPKPPPPPPPPVPPSTPTIGHGMRVRSFERTVWQAPFFSHSAKYGDTPLDRHVGNAIVLVEDENDSSVLAKDLERVSKLGVPLIVQGDTAAGEPYLNLIIAWWSSGGKLDDLRRSVARASERTRLPIIAYLDDDEWPASRPEWVTDFVYPSLQAYWLLPKTGEAFTMFERRVTDQLDRLQSYGQPIVLTPRWDDFNGSLTVEQVLSCIPLYERWMRDYFIVGNMPFADRRGGKLADGREVGGISKYPALWDAAQAFLFALPAGRPNRHDYRPRPADPKVVLKNKLGQTRSLITVEPWLKDYLRAELEIS